MFLKYIYYFNLLTYIVLMLLLTVYVHVYFLCKQVITLHISMIVVVVADCLVNLFPSVCLDATKYADLTNQTLSNCSNDLDGDFDESILGD